MRVMYTQERVTTLALIDAHGARSVPRAASRDRRELAGRDSDGRQARQEVVALTAWYAANVAARLHGDECDDCRLWLGVLGAGRRRNRPTSAAVRPRGSAALDAGRRDQRN